MAAPCDEKAIEYMQEFLQLGLVISPWLAGVAANGRFDASVFEFIDREARNFVDANWRIEDWSALFDNLPAPMRIPRTAIYEILASTAVSIAHNELGRPEVTLAMAHRAMQLFVQFAKLRGFSTIVYLYILATEYENHQAVDYYEPMAEREFITGQWHRPWVDYSLMDELQFSIASGNYSMVNDAARGPVISMTEIGRKNYQRVERILEQSGYLLHRVRQLYVSRFNVFEQYRALSHVVVPDWLPQRKEFLAWSGVGSGMKVLEVGSGDGEFTFNAGLADAVYPGGSVTCVDPSMGMLRRGKEHKEELHKDWVSYEQGQVEALPFIDESFDAVVGVSFLQFTEIAQALNEMYRVVRPGGIVACFGPVTSSLQTPILHEWFAALFDLAKKRKEHTLRDASPDPQVIRQAFVASGLVDVSEKMVLTNFLMNDPERFVQFTIRGLGGFQEELATIPWQAREYVITELEEVGRRLVKQYPPEQLFMAWAQQMIKGRKESRSDHAQVVIT